MAFLTFQFADTARAVSSTLAVENRTVRVEVDDHHLEFLLQTATFLQVGLADHEADHRTHTVVGRVVHGAMEEAGGRELGRHHGVAILHREQTHTGVTHAIGHLGVNVMMIASVIRGHL